MERSTKCLKTGDYKTRGSQTTAENPHERQIPATWALISAGVPVAQAGCLTTVPFRSMCGVHDAMECCRMPLHAFDEFMCPCGHHCRPQSMGWTNRVAQVDYYRCDKCGHFWTVPKSDLLKPTPLSGQF